jgi:DNA-binding NarL/FixJ family response regulator
MDRVVICNRNQNIANTSLRGDDEARAELARQATTWPNQSGGQTGECPMFKALIVEDNRRFGEGLRAALQAHFPRLMLEQAAGVQEALGKIDTLQPDLIVSDMRLPDGNGLELTRTIRAAGIESVIIVLTSHDLPEYREAALGSGANHFMTKGSVSITDIFGIIGSILASRLSTVACAESVPA